MTSAPLRSVSFAPYRPGQSPLTMVFPTPDQIEEDLRRGEESLRQLRGRAERLIQNQTSSNQEGIRLRQLESEAEAIRRTYNLVLDRVKDLEQQQSINPSNSQIVSRASPPPATSSSCCSRRKKSARARSRSSRRERSMASRS